jgi:hypothetical protein
MRTAAVAVLFFAAFAAAAPRRILVDTDMDSDDLLALLYILKHNRSEFDVKVRLVPCNLLLARATCPAAARFPSLPSTTRSSLAVNCSNPLFTLRLVAGCSVRENWSTGINASSLSCEHAACKMILPYFCFPIENGGCPVGLARARAPCTTIPEKKTG